MTWKNSESSKKILERLEIYGKSVQTSINWFSSSLFMANSGDVLGKLIPSAPEKKWGIPPAGHRKAWAKLKRKWPGLLLGEEGPGKSFEKGRFQEPLCKELKHQQRDFT